MAKVYLQDETFEVNRNSEVFGSIGNETLLISDDPNKVTVDNSVERIELGDLLASYSFSISGNVVTVKSGSTDVAVITLGDLSPKIAFTDGSADLVITGNNQATLGGAPIPTTSDSVPATLNHLDPSTIDNHGGAVTPTGTRLTTGWDELTGTSSDDIFLARVVQNTFGAQTNQLASGDIVDGGGGNDTLYAKVQMASALNDYPGSAIAPETVDLENAWFTALTAWNGPTTTYTANGSGQTSTTTTDGLLNRAETVVINAKDMLGLDLVASLQSDASLAIENLTTLTDTGDYAIRRNTEDVVIRMDHSGNDHAFDVASDMTVLFDNDYLIAGRSSTDAGFYWLEDRQGAEIDPSRPLNAINVDGITFTLNGVSTPIFIDPVSMVNFLSPTGTGGAGTWEGFVALLNTALDTAAAAALAAGNPTLSTSLTDLEVTLDYANLRILGLDGTVLPVPAPAMVLAAGGSDVVVPVEFHQYEAASGPYDVFGDLSDSAPESVFDPITATIELLKVGRGNSGGDLTVGGMCTDLSNEIWYGDSAIKHGVEVFNVEVFGDETQFSSLASLQSTNNTLEEVNVTWATGSLADLDIGNAHTGDHSASGSSSFSNSQPLKDVRSFIALNNTPAQTINGRLVTADVSVEAFVTDESVAKYMDRTDNADDPSADNANFVYNFGLGNDNLDLELSVANLEASGTTNREDFSMAINMGDGNDDVHALLVNGVANVAEADLTIASGSASSITAPWYINMKIDANLDINTGNGDDTVRTEGSSAWRINAGPGNDEVYTDNSGTTVVWDAEHPAVDVSAGRGIWAFNTADQTQGDVTVHTAQTILAQGLKSAAAVTAVNTATPAVAVNIANLTLTVNYKGLTSTVTVAGTDATAGAVVTDLSINQAIKAAINNDIYLSALLVAEDGPGRTLVVNSLTDGVMNDNDITLSLARSAATTAQTTAGAFILTDAQALALGFSAFTANVSPQTAAARFDSSLANNGTVDYMGGNSVSANANTVVDGTGFDVIVLSTDNTDTEHVNLTADAQKDLIFNVSNAHITGLTLDDIVVTPNTQTTGSVAFSALSSSLTVTASYEVAGVTTITGSALADTITVVAGGLGKATINGGAGADTITGGDGDDIINGEADDDTITGGAGADIITGGAGADTMTGGLGADDFVIGATESLNTSLDKITDYAAGADDLDLVTIPLAVVAGAGVTGAAGAADLVTGISIASTGSTAATLATDITTAVATLGANAFDDIGDTLILTVTGISVAGTGVIYVIQNQAANATYDVAADTVIALTGTSTAPAATTDFI